MGDQTLGPAEAAAVPNEVERPLVRLSANLLTTYKNINEQYYAKKRQGADLAVPDEELKKAKTANEDESESVGYDDAERDYVVRQNECWMGRYVIHSIIGKGSFGQVVHARDLLEDRDVAIKIIKNQEQFAKQAAQEVKILQLLNKNDTDDSKHIVRLLRHFKFRQHLCLVFEMLSITLYDLLGNTNFSGLPLSLVRDLGQQILTALDFLALEETNVIHCDLKPENVLLHGVDDTRLKVIDFGSSCIVGDRVYPYIQSRYYRSPEVLLGLQYTQAIDMWSLGCILVELLTGEALFNGANEAEQVYKISEMLGVPCKELLDTAQKGATFFERDESGAGYRRIATEKKYAAPGARVLADVVGMLTGGPDKPTRPTEPHLLSHYRLFQDLVENMLVYDPDERIMPQDALAHPFFTKPMGATPPSLSTLLDPSAVEPGTTRAKSASPPPTEPPSISKHQQHSPRSPTTQSPVTPIRGPERPRSPVRVQLQSPARRG